LTLAIQPGQSAELPDGEFLKIHATMAKVLFNKLTHEFPTGVLADTRKYLELIRAL